VLFRSAFFLANITKIEDGGYVPLLLAIAVYALMYIWHRGISAISGRIAENPIPIETFMEELAANHIARPPSTAIFLTRTLKDTPPVAVWYVDHAKALQQRVVAITVTTASTPRVAEDKCFSLVEIAPDFWRAVAHYGFMEKPDVPRLLRGLKAGGCTIDLADVTYYVGLESIVAREDGHGLPRWFVAIFAAMQRNAAHVTDVFDFPRDRVMEIGRQVAI
jgi:KUP system potassium uptake protein